MRILFITSTRIGDAVLSTGLLRALYERYPEAQFTIAAGDVSAPLFKDFSNLEKLIAVKKKAFSWHWVQLWQQVGLKKWDIVVDLRRSAITSLLRCKQAFVAPKHGGTQHKVPALAKTLDGVLDPMEVPNPMLWSGSTEAQSAAHLVPDREEGEIIIGFGPSANWRGKQWPAERFVKLAEKLTAPRGPFPKAKIAVFGAAHEKVMVKPILDLLPAKQLINLVGQCDLLTAYECCKRLDFFVGNDTGMMHVAAASGVPVLGLFGPSRDIHYGPWGKLTAVVRTDQSYEEITQHPDFCWKKNTSNMTSLSIDKVYKAAQKLNRRVKRG